MLAVVGGLGAACAWATTVMCAARATRLIGVSSVLAWVMLTGLAVTLPWAASQGVPDLDASAMLWLIVAGAGNCAGLLLVYSGLKIGKVGVVAPPHRGSGRRKSRPWGRCCPGGRRDRDRAGRDESGLLGLDFQRA